jgi:hypothetical protein
LFVINDQETLATLGCFDREQNRLQAGSPHTTPAKQRGRIFIIYLFIYF